MVIGVVDVIVIITNTTTTNNNTTTTTTIVVNLIYKKIKNSWCVVLTSSLYI